MIQNSRSTFYQEAVDALKIAAVHTSVLLAHEAVYLIGQVGNIESFSFLVSLLENISNHCMVRHEAAEALAAIGDLNAIPILQKHLSDESKPVKETCMLALRSLEEKAKNKCIQKSEFNTIDPIAQTVNKQNVSLDILEECLLNETCDLYERYEALFALRDMKTMQANNIIIRSLLDKTSAVFRHEVAFVLGQIQTPKCTEALINCLMNTSEDSMVRHEAALALGSVACSTEVTTTESFLNNIIKNLTEFTKDSDPIVAESCLVALDNIQQEQEQVVF